jgi:acyl carrier protein
LSEDDIEARVRSVLADVFGLNSAEIGPDTSADTIEAWDSLQHLTVVLSLEEEFDLQFTEEETVSVVSFPLIVMTVREKQALPGPA